MTFDPYSELIAESGQSELISQEGQALALMAQLLVQIHRIKPRCIDLLNNVYDEYSKLDLRQEDFDQLIVPNDAWRSLVTRFIDRRFENFLAVIQSWREAVMVEHDNALIVLLMVISDPRLIHRDQTMKLRDHMLAVMLSYSRLARSHGALEYSLSPMLTLPIYNPVQESRATFLQRCQTLIDVYMEDVESVHKKFGAVKFVRRTAEVVHIRALAYRVLFPNKSWGWIAMQPEIGLSDSSPREGAMKVAKRIGIKIPRRKPADDS